MRVDLSGKRFGRLVAESVDTVRGNGETYWLCKCDCGNVVTVSRGNLKSGITQSCGCFQRERTSETRKKQVKYDLSGEYGIGYTTNKDSKFLFDLEDFHLIKPYSWFVNDQGYILAIDGKKRIRMHKLVSGISGIVDHRNNLRYDNRKKNLRPATKQQNNINRGCNKNNRLGAKGVTKIRDRYYARIQKDGKSISLGGYSTIEDAIAARNQAEHKYFGSYAFEGGDDIA